jgi:predicted Zn-dependent protease
MSEQEEVAAGKQYYSITTQLSEGEAPHREVQNLVTRVGLKMAESSERPNLPPWEFNVVDSNEPNAYALPGGKLSITRGLISKMESEDQLASVLGHEIGHVAAKHAVVSASRQQLLGAVLGVGGAVLQSQRTPGVGAIALAGQIGATLIVQKYSRDQERQADELGMKYMTAAGYNPRAFVETMQILERAAKEEPDTVLVAYFAGRALEDLGDRQGAAQQFAKVAQATQGQGEYGEYAVTRLREWGLLS